MVEIRVCLDSWLVACFTASLHRKLDPLAEAVHFSLAGISRDEGATSSCTRCGSSTSSPTDVCGNCNLIREWSLGYLYIMHECAGCKGI